MYTGIDKYNKVRHTLYTDVKYIKFRLLPLLTVFILTVSVSVMKAVILSSCFFNLNYKKKNKNSNNCKIQNSFIKNLIKVTNFQNTFSDIYALTTIAL